MKYLRALVSWLIVAWMCYIFLGSLPYKFTNHPDTQHIFGTIGDWIGGFVGTGIGNLFSNFGAYAVGGFELLTSIVLLLPIVLWVLSRFSGSYFGITDAGSTSLAALWHPQLWQVLCFSTWYRHWV